MVRQIGKLILFASIACAEDYYVTYKLYTDNFMIQNESIQISKAMVAKGGRPFKYVTFVSNQESVEDLIFYEKERIINALLQHYAVVKSQTTTANYTAKTNTHLYIYPTRIKVEINNGLAKIGLFQ